MIVPDWFQKLKHLAVFEMEGVKYIKLSSHQYQREDGMEFDEHFDEALSIALEKIKSYKTSLEMEKDNEKKEKIIDGINYWMGYPNAKATATRIVYSFFNIKIENED